MANKVTPDDISKMVELYKTLKTYSAVAKATGFSPSTVSRYIKESAAIKTYSDTFAAKPIEEIKFEDLISFSFPTVEELLSYEEWKKEFGV